MSRLIRVFVCDRNGFGVHGQKVKTYGGETQYTDSSGLVSFVVESSNVSVYVNGATAYNGATSRAEDPIVFRKS